MSTSSVKTIDRLVEVVDCFTRDQESWSLAELCAHLNLPKSTLHRFLVGLETHGILRREADDNRWRLGYRLFVWGSLAMESTRLGQVARPIMRELADTTGETVILTEYHDYAAICTDKIETGHSVRLALEVGKVRAPHAGASSKALLAYLPEEEIQAVIREKGLPRLCTNTITDPDELRAELGRIREHGYATSREETDAGAWGVATPIRNWKDEVVAAIGIAGPAVRFSDELAQRYIQLCCQAARRISALLGSRLE